jgi:hypothetical protein
MGGYQEAIQAPALCFHDGELREACCVVNDLGLPRPVCGQFATVYALESGDRRWAVKCFLRNVSDLHERYARIAEHLARHSAEFFVGFQMLRRGILVGGEWYPLLKMEWVEGLTLNQYVQRNLKHRRRLEDLSRRWESLRAGLRARRVAHGDLQHGNVLVADDGRLRLVDYDGMWVPALASMTGIEMGHPNYQSPRRRAQDIDEDVDDFAGTLIATALRALRIDPDLWSRHDNGDNLLFRESDLRNPQRSPLFGALQALGDDEVDRGLEVLEPGLRAAPRRAPRAATRRERARPAPAPDRPGTVPALLGRVRVLLHIVGIWPAAVLAALGLGACVAGDADRTTTIAAPAFAIAATVGLASFLSLYVIRTMHSTLCTLFFGLMATIGLVGLGAEWLTRGSLAAIAEIDTMQLALIIGLPALGVLAAPVEVACHRLGVITIWRLRGG